MISVVEARRFPGPPGSTNELAAPIGPDDAMRTVGPFAMVGRHALTGVPPGVLPVDADVRPHPHIGLVAITYVLDGYITHRDSLGNRRELGPGSVLQQVAGSGIVHSERYERLRLLGGSLELFQMLLALPDGAEEAEPSYRYVPTTEVPLEQLAGATVRWLSSPSAGRAPLDLPMAPLLCDVTLEVDARWSPPDLPERALYLWQGAVVVDGVTVTAGQTALLGPGATLVRATESARFLAFGGTNVGPRYHWWNYLHSSLDRVEEAKAEWRAGRVKLPVGDTESFTPAPPDAGRPLRRLNAS